MLHDSKKAQLLTQQSAHSAYLKRQSSTQRPLSIRKNTLKLEFRKQDRLMTQGDGLKEPGITQALAAVLHWNVDE